MRSLDAALITAKNKLDSDDPWLYMIELTHEDWEILYYDNLTDDFHEGATVTGSNSGASAEIYFIYATSATTGFLVMSEITSGPFTENETITDNHSASPGSAQVTTPLPTGEAVFRFVRNNEDVTFETNIWYKFNFTIDAMTEAVGKMPSVTLTISNADRTMEGYINKGEGFIGDEVRLIIVYAGDLTTDPAIDEVFAIKSVEITSEFASFTLGIPNPLLEPFPSVIYNRRICRFKFKESDCGYSGGDTTCEKTMTDCISKSNQDRFGGFPGIPGSFFDF